jgi:CubicO group peptidase (beta-lactamase class C family)
MFLGYIIEKVAGKKYEHVVREHVFSPLGMAHSGFDFTHLKSIDKAIGYDAITGNKGSKSMIVDSSVSFAAGAIYSTVGDMYKWNRALSTEKILKKSSYENAFTPRLSKYGLGWGIDSIDGKRILAHNGGIHGFLSHNSVLPADNISITILSNVGSTRLGQLTKDVQSILYNKEYKVPEVLKEITVDRSMLTQYEGVYELAPTFKITVRLVDAALKAQATGQPEFDLFAKSENVFFLKVVDAQLEFVKNEKGEVEKLILHQNGLHQPAKKVK